MKSKRYEGANVIEFIHLSLVLELKVEELYMVVGTIFEAMLILNYYLIIVVIQS